jgi:hypothetical protein
LAWLVQARIGKLEWWKLARTAGVVCVASAVMAAACYATLALIPAGDRFAWRFAAVAAPLGVSLAVYFGMMRLFGLNEIWLLFRRERKT